MSVGARHSRCLGLQDLDDAQMVCVVVQIGQRWVTERDCRSVVESLADFLAGEHMVEVFGLRMESTYHWSVVVVAHSKDET